MDVKKMSKVDKSLSIKDRIAFLQHCADLYETNGSSPISDQVYDQEYYELEKLDGDNPFFYSVGGIADAHIYGTAVKHDVIMGSLSKCVTIDDVLPFLNSVYGNLKVAPAFVLQHKIDGTSIGCHYENGKLVKVLSRGDGETGIDITENGRQVRGVKATIAYKGSCEIRGECHKNRQDFYKKWHTSVGGSYKNPRNFTAGMMNSKDPEDVKKAELDFIAYEVVKMDFVTETEKNKFIEEQGFKTLNSTTRKTKEGITFEQVVKAVAFYMEKIDRDNLFYDIDGVVVKLEDIKAAKKLGTTSGGRKPKANRAVKFPAEEKETRLEDVIEQVGRTGVIKPVGIVKGVELGGAIIKRVSLHNYGALIGKDAIKIGSIVVVAKKGDIIPQIVRIKTNIGKDVTIPTNCPECGSVLAWTTNDDDEKVDLICNNEDCIAQLAKKIDYWFKTIGVKGFGKGTIEKLTDKDVLEWDGKPIISSLEEMYYMLDNDRKTEHPFRKYAYLKSQLGEKTYENLLESIKSVKAISLPLFIEALGIGHIGSSSKDIADIAPTVDDVDKLTVNDLLNISGFGSSKANNFVDAWSTRSNEIKTLLKYVEIKAVKQASDKLKGKKFCFTGSFENPTRSEMEKLVGSHGGKLSSVSKDLTALVFDGESMKGKYEKATTLKVPIITQDDFMAMLK